MISQRSAGSCTRANAFPETIGYTMYYWKEHSFCQLKKEQQEGRRSTITGTVEVTRI